MENVAQKNLVRRYLLGDLPEREQLQLEQEYFADGELFEAIWDCENELVDAYVRGQLPKQERERFERHYLTTPKHQHRVAVARRFVPAADATIVQTRETVSETADKPSWWATFLALFSVPQMAWGGALALLLLTLGGWWYFRQTPVEQIAQTTPSVQPSVPVTAPPTTATTPVPVAPSSPPQVSPSAPATTVPAVLAFALGGALRAPGEVQPLVIPRGTKQVRMQIKLEGEAYPRYQIKLRSAGGATVLNQTSLLPTLNRKAVAVLIPASKLSPGDYILTLSGVTSTNETEELHQHLLHVTYK